MKDIQAKDVINIVMSKPTNKHLSVLKKILHHLFLSVLACLSTFNQILHFTFIFEWSAKSFDR